MRGSEARSPEQRSGEGPRSGQLVDAGATTKRPARAMSEIVLDEAGKRRPPLWREATAMKGRQLGEKR